MADSQTFRHAIKKGILVLGDKETKFLCEQFENLMPIIEHIRVVVAGSMRGIFRQFLFSIFSIFGIFSLHSNIK